MWKSTASVAIFAVLLFIASTWSMPGGLITLNKDDAGVRKVLDYAVNQHNRRRNDMYRSEVVEVVRAQSQLVAGLKHIVTAKMTRTNCRKQKENEVCGPMDGQTYMCTFTVYSRPWLNEITLMDEKCDS